MKVLAWYTIILYSLCIVGMVIDLQDTNIITILGLIMLAPVFIFAILYLVYNKSSAPILAPMPTILCGRCHALNKVTSAYCFNCGSRIV